MPLFLKYNVILKAGGTGKKLARASMNWENY